MNDPAASPKRISRTKAHALRQLPPASASDSSTADKIDRRQRSDVLVEPATVPEVSELMFAAAQHTLLSGMVGVSVAVVLATVAWSFVPANYEASSFVQVRSRVAPGFANSQSRAEDAAFARAQKARVTEQPVLAAALQRPEAEAFTHALPEYRVVEWLRNRTHVKLDPGSEVMTVTVDHPTPDVSLALNTAITTAYLEDHQRRSRESREQQQAELKTAANEADRLLSEQWQKLHEAAGQVGSGSQRQLTVRDEIQMQGYREYAQRLRAAQLEANQLRSRLADEQIRLEEQQQEPTDASLEALLLQHPQVVVNRERLRAIETQLREISAIASSDDSPRILRLKEDRDRYALELENLLETLRPQMRERLAESRTDPRGDRLALVREEIDRNGDEIAFLQDMLTQLESQLRRTGSSGGVRLEMIRHTIDRQAKLADSLWESLERLKIESRSPSRVSLIESAKLPESPNRGRQLKAASSAGLMGLIFSVLSIGYVEWRGCRVRHPRDVLLRTKLSLFGTGSFAHGLPWLWRLRHGKRDPLDSGVHEVVAHLMLKRSRPDRLPSVLVSSATDGEPRHVVAVELARSLAASGFRTLLVDADLATSRLTRSLDAGDRPGVGQCEEQPLDADALCVSTNEPRLSFLPAGTNTDGSHRGHSASRAVSSILDSESETFHAVVVCGPAVLTNAESILLASRVDETVFAMVLGRSRWNLLGTAHHRMEFAGVSVLGAVLHVASPRARQDRLQLADDHNACDDSPEEALRESLRDLGEDVRRVSKMTPPLRHAAPAKHAAEPPPANGTDAATENPSRGKLP